MIKKFLYFFMLLSLVVVLSGCISKTYTISFDSNGGTSIDSITTDGRSDVGKLAEPKNEGFYFGGWYLDDETFLDEFASDTLLNNPIAEDITLYAQWIQPVRVIFYNIDEAIEEIKEIKPGDKVSSLDYQIEDELLYTYEFAGWYLDKEHQELNDFALIVEENLQLYPKFNKVKKTIDFKGLKISILGDEFTTFYDENSPLSSYYSPPEEWKEWIEEEEWVEGFHYPNRSETVKNIEDTWWVKLIQRAELELGINNSFNYTPCYNWGESDSMSAMNQHRIDTLGQNGAPDIILVHIGQMDIFNGVQTIMFESAYRIMINRVEKAYPDAIVFLSTIGSYGFEEGGSAATRQKEFTEFIRKIALEKDYFIFAVDEIQTDETWLEYLDEFAMLNLDGMNAYADKIYDTFVEVLN